MKFKGSEMITWYITCFLFIFIFYYSNFKVLKWYRECDTYFFLWPFRASITSKSEEFYLASLWFSPYVRCSQFSCYAFIKFIKIIKSRLKSNSAYVEMHRMNAREQGCPLCSLVRGSKDAINFLRRCEGC